MIDQRTHCRACAFARNQLRQADDGTVDLETFAYSQVLVLGMLVRRMHATPEARGKALSIFLETARKVAGMDSLLE